MRLRERLASAATLGNAAAGILACGLAISDHPELSALMILAGVLLDSCDGALARSLNAVSRFGAELDSLADVITFGVAPTVLIGTLLPEGDLVVGWLLIAAYPLCAAWRLARFNVVGSAVHSDHRGFVGLPSTGAGAAAATAVLLHLRLVGSGFGLLEAFLPALLLALAVLMVSQVRYRHASVYITRLSLPAALVLAALFVLGSVLWEYQFLFVALVWSYILSGPLALASSVLRAVDHA